MEVIVSVTDGHKLKNDTKFEQHLKIWFVASRLMIQKNHLVPKSQQIQTDSVQESLGSAMPLELMP